MRILEKGQNRAQGSKLKAQGKRVRFEDRAFRILCGKNRIDFFVELGEFEGFLDETVLAVA
jgi:hypothetical protein